VITECLISFLTEGVGSFSISFFILLIIYISLRKQTEKTHYDNILFSGMIFLNMMLLVDDFIQIIVDEKSGLFFHVANQVTSFILYAAAPLLTLMWLYYADYFIHKDQERVKRIHRWMLIVIAINTILSALSMYFNIYFYIDAQNVYYRGNFYWVYMIITYAFVVLSYITIISHHKNIKKSSFFPMLVFAIPPAVGGIIQSIYYGLLLVWPMTMISVFLVYVFVQSHRANTDYLTNLYNKREFDNYVIVQEKSHLNKKYLAGIIADLDHFKMINDQYGHYMGDQILTITADLLRKSFGKNDFIARVGGDEFGVLMKVTSKEALNEAIETLNRNFDAFNQKKLYPFEIKVSIGADLYNSQKHGSVNDFIKRLDELMYANKIQS